MKFKKGLVLATALIAATGISMKVDAAEYSDKYTFTLEGKTYTLPFAIDEFTKNGWTLVDFYSSVDNYDELELSGEMSGMSYSDVKFVNGKKMIDACILNYSEDTAQYKDSYVASITVKPEDDVEFETADKVSLDSKKEDVLRIYGEPVGYEEGTTLDLDYSFQKMAEAAEKAKQAGNGIQSISTVDFELFSHQIGSDELLCDFSYDNKEKEDMQSLTLGYYAALEDDTTTSSSDEKATTEKKEETTEKKESTSTSASTELGDDVYSGTVQLNDVVYTLPIAGKDLIANGYSFELTGKVPGGRTSESSEVYYNNLSAGYMWLANQNKNAAEIDDCVIYKVSNENGDIVVPGGIKLGNTLDDLIKAYPELDGMEPGDSSTKGNHRIYVSKSYGDDGNYTIQLEDKDTYYSVEFRIEPKRGNIVSAIECRMYLQ